MNKEQMEARWTKHKRKGLSEMRPCESDDDMDGISVSDEDKKLPTLVGGWIARNPNNHADQWYVAKVYYDENLEPVADDTIINKL